MPKIDFSALFIAAVSPYQRTSTRVPNVDAAFFIKSMSLPGNEEEKTGTLTISLGGNISFGVGASISIGLSLDRYGNGALQWSYSLPVPTETNTANVGIVDAGISAQVQYTNAQTVFDLEGSSVYFGATGGAGLYAGADLLTFHNGTIAELTGDEFDGFVLQGGYGAGVDIHMVQSYTQTIHSFRWR